MIDFNMDTFQCANQSFIFNILEPNLNISSNNTTGSRSASFTAIEPSSKTYSRKISGDYYPTASKVPSSGQIDKSQTASRMPKSDASSRIYSRKISGDYYPTASKVPSSEHFQSRKSSIEMLFDPKWGHMIDETCQTTCRCLCRCQRPYPSGLRIQKDFVKSNIEKSKDAPARYRKINSSYDHVSKKAPEQAYIPYTPTYFRQSVFYPDSSKLEEDSLQSENRDNICQKINTKFLEDHNWGLNTESIPSRKQQTTYGNIFEDGLGKWTKPGFSYATKFNWLSQTSCNKTSSYIEAAKKNCLEDEYIKCPLNKKTAAKLCVKAPIEKNLT